MPLPPLHPLPPTSITVRPKRSATRLLLISLAVILGGALTMGRATGVLRYFSVPTGSMEPAIAKGDYVITEGVTYFFRKPQRGDLLVFHTNKLKYEFPGKNPDEIYVKRLAGEPGEKLRISDGKLCVNDVPAAFANAKGEIHMVPGGMSCLRNEGETVTVPEGHYLVLGDNMYNSLDSRYFGFVPAESIVGRVVLCYLPFGRMGWVK